jgi:3-hydroxyacyl-[acyl-carrier-protein] dehydratase
VKNESLYREAIAGCALDELARLENGDVRRQYRFKHDFIGFSGHFPGYPILPAFIQVLTALVLMEEVKGVELTLESLKKGKFHIEIKPDTTVEVTCRERMMPGISTIEADLRVDGKLASTFVLVTQSP